MPHLVLQLLGLLLVLVRAQQVVVHRAVGVGHLLIARVEDVTRGLRA